MVRFVKQQFDAIRYRILNLTNSQLIYRTEPNKKVIKELKTKKRSSQKVRVVSPEAERESMVGRICERGRFWDGSERERELNVCLPLSKKFAVLTVIMQISTSVPRTTEVVALKPTATTPQEATRAPVSQDTSGTESAVQVGK